jgi:cyclophilin family peptidyl-prolyl cis-trans isomerase
MISFLALQASLFLHAAELEPGLYAKFTTSKGEFIAVLHAQQVPVTVANFVGLAEGSKVWIDLENAKVSHAPFFDGLTFHRVIDGFMIQSGSPSGDGSDTPGYSFPDEFVPELRHDGPGVLSMANAGANTNGSQFFVTLDATEWLDDVHSIFGRVVEGMDVVEMIGAVDTDGDDKPLEPVVLQKVDILRIGEEAEAFDPEAAAPMLPRVHGVQTSITLYDADLALGWDLTEATDYWVFIGETPTKLYGWRTFWSWPGVIFTNGLSAPEAYFKVIGVHYPAEVESN